MAAFIRRFTSDPDEATLLAIEGVVVVDTPPTSTVRGTSTGTVLCVGETEDGVFCADEGAVEVFGDPDLRSKFGGFGFTYDGIVSQHPCCRGRSADGATVVEHWNGSVFVQLRSCRFSRLFVGRVDTSVGAVELTRLAFLAGSTDSTFDFEPAWTLLVSLEGAGNVTVTWDAAVATILSADGSYPYAPAGGEQIVFAIDGTQYTATFQASDTTHTAVVARLNAAAGFTAFVESTLKTRISGVIRGTAGSVQIVSGTASALTATGFSAGAAVPGTGDVANIDIVTLAEVKSRVEADAPGASVDRDPSGRVRIFSTEDDGTGSIEVDSTSTAAAALGFDTEVEVTQVSVGVAGSLPAGTRVSASGSAQLFVAMQTTAVTAANPGPYSLKVRHATDDQSGTSEIAGAVDTLYATLQLAPFAVTNPLPVTAALTDAQVDARYALAIDKTRGVSSRVREVNVVWSARQSNAVRNAIKQNALDASAQGCFGRMSVVRPPLGTSRATAEGSTPPGVGAYRDTIGNNVYAFPGVRKLIPEIQVVGSAGGTGFTDDGIVNAGSDALVCSLMSNLNPEENIGQETSGIADWVLGIESGNADVADLQLEDYVAFKAAGICAPRVDESVTVQSAVTTVDPGLYPALAPINRRRFAYFYQDSIARFSRSFVKKLGTKTRRALLVSRFNTFAQQLLTAERIDGKLIDGSLKAGNTPESLARNVFITIHKIRMTPTLDVIVLKTEVGNDVSITEL